MASAPPTEINFLSDEKTSMAPATRASANNEETPAAGTLLWKKQEYDKRQESADAESRKRKRSSDEEMTTGVDGESEDKKFRMNAKSFWLTYSALYRGELDHIRILSMLMSKGTLVEYSIGCEHHKEETVADLNRDEHFHVYVAYENKKNIKSPRYIL